MIKGLVSKSSRAGAGFSLKLAAHYSAREGTPLRPFIAVVPFCNFKTTTTTTQNEAAPNRNELNICTARKIYCVHWTFR